jgi:small subunit ribosomal protein S16
VIKNETAVVRFLQRPSPKRNFWIHIIFDHFLKITGEQPMVRIRLRRTGLRHQPTYRVVVADKESPRDGRFLEIVGHYNPTTEPFTLEVKEDRVYEWMKNGALPSESVMKLFKITGLLERYERFKKGEPVEKLLEEAKKVSEERAAQVKAK